MHTGTHSCKLQGNQHRKRALKKAIPELIKINFAFPGF